MVIFDIIMTLIESFLLPYFTFKILGISNQKISIVITAILCFLEIYVLNTVILNNFIALLLLIFTNFIVLYLIKKELNLYYFIIPSIIIGLLISSNVLALLITVAVFGIKPENIGINMNAIITLSLISRIIYVLLCYIFYKIEKGARMDRIIVIKKDYWIVFVTCFFSFLSIYTILYESVFYNVIERRTIYRMLFLFIVLITSFIVLYFKMQQDYHKNLMISNELMKTQYSKETYDKVNKLSYEMLQEKHHMFYILLNLKDLATKNKNTEIIEFIDKKITDFQSFELTQRTKSPLFDYYILDYISELKKDGYSIKTIISIDNHIFLENVELINLIRQYIEDMVEYACNSKKIEIFLSDNESSYLILKITTTFNKELFLQKDIKSEYIKKVDLINTTDNEVELRVLFKF